MLKRATAWVGLCLVTLAFLSWSVPTFASSQAGPHRESSRELVTTSNFTAVADAFVNSAHPSKNYGTSTVLRVDGNPIKNSYLRFSISGLSSAVSKAVLQVYADTSLSSGLALHAVSNNTWDEKTITYQNAPPMGATLGTYGAITGGTWISMDVTSYVTGNGTYSFGLTDSKSKAVSLASRESTYLPLIVVSTGSSTLATSTPVPTATKMPTPVPSPTLTSTPIPTATKAPTAAPSPTPTQSSQPQPYGQTGTWYLKWYDEFNGTQLDLNKWQPNWLAGDNTSITKPVNSNEESCYDPKQVSVANGYLTLSAVARTCLANNGTTYNYASGLVNSRPHYTFNYGYMEARVWLDGSSSIKNWPAFWADGTGTWPTTGEIDVMEGLGGKPSWHYHWGTSSSPQQTGGYPTMSSSVGWHIFAADWEPGYINYYYDGVRVGQVTSNVVNSYMFLILNYGLSSTISPPIQVPSNMLVDYVRVWQKSP